MRWGELWAPTLCQGPRQLLKGMDGNFKGMHRHGLGVGSLNNHKILTRRKMGRGWSGGLEAEKNARHKEQLRQKHMGRK